MPASKQIAQINSTKSSSRRSRRHVKDSFACYIKRAIKHVNTVNGADKSDNQRKLTINRDVLALLDNFVASYLGSVARDSEKAQRLMRQKKMNPKAAMYALELNTPPKLFDRIQQRIVTLQDQYEQLVANESKSQK